MQSHLLISSLLLSLTLSWSNAMPVPRSVSADGPHDVRWRLVAGMETVHNYVVKLVSCGSNSGDAAKNSAFIATNFFCLQALHALQ